MQNPKLNFTVTHTRNPDGDTVLVTSCENRLPMYPEFTLVQAGVYKWFAHYIVGDGDTDPLGVGGVVYTTIPNTIPTPVEVNSVCTQMVYQSLRTNYTAWVTNILDEGHEVWGGNLTTMFSDLAWYTHPDRPWWDNGYTSTAGGY